MKCEACGGIFIEVTFSRPDGLEVIRLMPEVPDVDDRVLLEFPTGKPNAAQFTVNTRFWSSDLKGHARCRVYVS